MRLTFLGTGTSFGVPVLGCDCATCTSRDPRDRRTRHAALVEHAGGTLLVDTPPELRMQLLAAGAPRVDAVWYTHCHADHVHGVDDLRIFTMRQRRAMPVYASAAHAEELRARFAYVFDPEIVAHEGTSKPEAELRPVRAYEPVDVDGLEVLPLLVPHGHDEVYGFRAGELAYITDAKQLPPRTFQAVRGARVLVLNALWFGDPHPTHLNVEEAVEVAARVGAERTYLTHLTHRVRHDELVRRLPPGVEPAYDGLVVEV
jgi:phosphoribosyl 1,2-cyclic phosphate phosphodiesterase